MLTARWGIRSLFLCLPDGPIWFSLGNGPVTPTCVYCPPFVRITTSPLHLCVFECSEFDRELKMPKKSRNYLTRPRPPPPPEESIDAANCQESSNI